MVNADSSTSGRPAVALTEPIRSPPSHPFPVAGAVPHTAPVPRRHSRRPQLPQPPLSPRRSRLSLAPPRPPPAPGPRRSLGAAVRRRGPAQSCAATALRSRASSQPGAVARRRSPAQPRAATARRRGHHPHPVPVVALAPPQPGTVTRRRNPAQSRAAAAGQSRVAVARRGLRGLRRLVSLGFAAVDCV